MGLGLVLDARHGVGHLLARGRYGDDLLHGGLKTATVVVPVEESSDVHLLLRHGAVLDRVKREW